MRYTVWPGNPSGDDEDTSRCIAEVFDRMYNDHKLTRQCKRDRGWKIVEGKIRMSWLDDLDGQYCRQHAQQLARKWQEGDWLGIVGIERGQTMCEVEGACVAKEEEH